MQELRKLGRVPILLKGEIEKRMFFVPRKRGRFYLMKIRGSQQAVAQTNRLPFDRLRASGDMLKL
ncbi:MAG: hypothetical protein A2V86_06065 [Deltaproteobacteria bacterium RBG_16_49_23]|nr:MAG: hypothetical protein A2V86_06065 [Deltaproteobacteria bacterium RBG_16_49_23]